MNLIEKISRLFGISDELINLLENLDCNICFFCDRCIKVIIHVLQRFIKEDNKSINNSLMTMSVITGMGGEDAQDITNQILNMYFKSLLILDDISIYDRNNIVFKNCKLFNLLSKYEKCIYKIVRISPFSNKKQTSYIGINFCIHNFSDVSINIDDIEFKYTRSSGSGGQHVNKTNSCVIAKHIPTSLSVKISQERNQLQNKSLAIKILTYKVNKHILDKNKLSKKNNYTCKQKISFGSNFDRYINMHKDKFFKTKIDSFKHNEDDISNLSIIPVFFKNIIDSN